MRIQSLLVITILATASCRPTHNGSLTGGGKGGHSIIAITPTAYAQFVDTCTVYIKYGSTDIPANGVYDDSATCTVVNGQPYAVFRGLTSGNYYFQGIGFHSGYGHPPNVRGGLYVAIQNDGDSVVKYLPTYSYNP